MSLHLNGKQIKGSSLKLSATLTCAGDDLSGDSSMSSSAETGEKPQAVNVNLLVKYDNADDLKNIVNLARAKETLGNRVIYRINNRTANAMNIRKVKFEGDVSVIEDESLELWRVSFKLLEVQSVPEVIEQRIKKQAVSDVTPEAATVVNGTVTPEVALTSLEKVVQVVEDLVTPSDETE